MSKFPRDLSGHQVIKSLSKLGFVVLRQRGSHVVLEKVVDDQRWGCVVPVHDHLKTGTVKGILKQARVEESAFLEHI